MCDGKPRSAEMALALRVQELEEQLAHEKEYSAALTNEIIVSDTANERNIRRAWGWRRRALRAERKYERALLEIAGDGYCPPSTDCLCDHDADLDDCRACWNAYLDEQAKGEGE